MARPPPAPPYPTSLTALNNPPSKIQAAEVQPEDVVANPPTSIVTSSRRRSSTKVPGLKRAFSSPNVRSFASGVESVPLSPGDKKRNKLGYHRSAVACGTKQKGSE
jgi:hypothetical protein